VATGSFTAGNLVAKVPVANLLTPAAYALGSIFSAGSAFFGVLSTGADLAAGAPLRAIAGNLIGRVIQKFPNALADPIAAVAGKSFDTSRCEASK
jgi:hypothetical protein